MFRLISVIAISIGLSTACSPAEESQPSTITPNATPGDVTQTNIQTSTHLFERLADGVYFATGSGPVNVASNALVIINEDDVVVVDSHITADAGRALLQSIRQMTDKPISYLINSHFHFDHAHGNQIFAGNTDIIGHEYTRAALMDDPLAGATYQTIGSPAAQSEILAVLDAQIAAGEGDPAFLQAQRAMLQRHIEALSEVIPTPPNITLSDTMTLRQGSREIRLIHPGRGHTGGDVIVYLPAERIVFTGDLLYPGAPYLGDGFADEFPATLEVVKALDVDVIAGGHGGLMRDKTGIELSQTYIKAYWNQVADAFEKGLPASEAAAQVDFSGYEEFAAFQLGNPKVIELEVARMYERMRKHAAQSE